MNAGPIDSFVDVPGGCVFVRRWNAGRGGAPIVLLHASLGCVDLWRDFPQAPAQVRETSPEASDAGRSDPAC